MLDFEFKNRYDIGDLLKIIRVLRSENGCPWDKVQTHESIRTDLIEEAYEVCEGIDCNSPEILREELGDLLLQVVFHTEIETENGNFNFDNVCNDICHKLVYRHPHVFGNVKADTESDVLKNWDALKKAGKHQETYSETLESVPKTFPALLRGEKVCKRAMRAGLPIDNIQDCIDEIKRSLDSLNTENADANNAQNQQTLGKISLSLCNLNRILHIDGEKALTYSTNRFITAFKAAEEEIISGGGSMDKLSDEELHQMAYKVISAL